MIDVHLIPVDELKEHKCSMECSCEPTVWIKDDVIIYEHSFENRNILLENVKAFANEISE